MLPRVMKAWPSAPALPVGLLLIVSIPFLFVHLGFPLLDPDEGLYALIAYEMLRSGDWVVPYINGVPYVEKPPLYFWLTALAMAVAGPADWAVRIWSALAALGAAFLTWRLGRRLYGEPAGLLAGLALMSTVGFALFVRRASTDLLFVGCLTLAVYGFVRDVERPEAGRRRFLLCYLGVALSVLTKGFIGLLFPLAIVGVALLVVRRLSPREMNLGWGLAVFAAVALPWHVALAVRAPALAWFYLVENQILRFLDARTFVEDDVPISTVGFLVTAFLWLFPWSVFALARPRPGTGPSAAWRPVAALWAVVVLLFFALSRFKHEYYALPAFPAVALIAGAAWASGRDVGRWLGVALPGCLAVGAWALWVGAGLTPEQALWGLAQLNAYYRIVHEQGLPFPFDSARPFGILLQALGAVLIVGWALAGLAWLGGLRRTAFVTVVGVAAAIALLVMRMIDLVEPHHTTKAVSRAITARAAPADAIVYEGSLEYSLALPFYAGRPVRLVNGALGYFQFAAGLPETRALFMDTGDLLRLWEGPGRVFLVIRRPPAESVVAALPPGRVHDLGRFGSHRLFSNHGHP